MMPDPLTGLTFLELLALTGASAGLSALGDVVVGEGQEVQSFRDVFDRGTPQDNLVDPAQLLFFTNQGAARLGQALTEVAEQPFQFGPASIVQSPPFFFGGDLPFPIGLTASDPGFLPTPGKILNDPFNSLGGFEGAGGGEGGGEGGGGRDGENDIKGGTPQDRIDRLQDIIQNITQNITGNKPNDIIQNITGNKPNTGEPTTIQSPAPTFSQGQSFASASPPTAGEGQLRGGRLRTDSRSRDLQEMLSALRILGAV